MFIKSSILIDSPVEEVYRVAELYPSFVKFYVRKFVIENSVDEIRVAVGYKLFGFPVYWNGTGKKNKNHSISYIQTDGFLKGMKADWEFIPERGKTQVSININSNKSIPLFNWFIRKTLKDVSNRILLDLEEAVVKGNI